MSLDIGFIAVSQAHQYLHWLPAALRLAREPGVRVTVLGSTGAGLDLVRRYDPGGDLRLLRLSVPLSRRDGLFSAPPRSPVLLLNSRLLSRLPVLVTTETTSGLLRRLPWFRSQLVLIKHGAGDREGSYNPKHRLFDLILVNGEKHRAALVERGLAAPGRCVVTGNAKLELKPPPLGIFADGKPLTLYNPHFDPKLSSWFDHGGEVVRQMERMPEWNHVVAPHVKLRGGPNLRSTAPNVHIDLGSVRSIDMSYTHAADIYIGDVSSQVYEFIQRPRPCVFLNPKRIAWQGDPAFAHWHMGQVITQIAELPEALDRAAALQPKFEPIQQRLASRSIAQSDQPASVRQARAILDFARRAST